MNDAERSLYLRRLRFPPELERAFQEEYYKSHRRTLRINAILMAAAFVTFACLKWVQGDHSASNLLVWLAYCLNALVFLPLTTLRAAGRFWQQYVVVDIAIFYAAMLAYAARFTAALPETTPDERVIFFLSWLMPMMVGSVITRLQFRWALLFQLFSIGGALWAGLTRLNVPPGKLIAAVPVGPGFLAMGLLMAAFSQERQHRSAFLANYLLDLERAKSENLLTHLMPSCIATRLKGATKAVADHHDAVTVLFADIVDFTPIAAQNAAHEVVQILNEVFSRFDRLVEQHGLEKIKTVGDCYMVMAGAPNWRSDHLEQSARLALEMQKEAAQLSIGSRWPVRFRIGIHTGPLVAGVIGETRFVYDVWGDTVNTASRLESSGVPGRIQVSAEVAEKLGSSFLLRRRGEVEIKGKGILQTYFLEDEIGVSGCTRDEERRQEQNDAVNLSPS